MNTRNLMIFLAAATISLPIHAANGVSESAIQYHDWQGAKPNVVTMISSTMPKQFVLFRGSNNVSWEDVNRNQVPALQAHLCALMNRSNNDTCKGSDTPAVFIREAFLGTPDEFRTAPSALSQSNKIYIGLDQLTDLPPGATRVLQLIVQTMGHARTVISVAYDDIPDDDLRMMALEDGIYRAARWRSD